MPDIFAQAQAFRAALLRRDNAALAAITEAYGQAYARLLRQLADLLNQIEERRRQGLPDNPAWLYKAERYNSLLRDMDKEFRRFGQNTGALVRNRQADEFRRGARDAATLVETGAGQTRAGVDFNRLAPGAVETLVGQFQDASPLVQLFDEIAPLAAAQAKEVLTNAVVQGWSPKKAAVEMRRALGIPLSRALTIARTETIRAYREAAREQYQANDDILQGWVWTASKSLRTCLNCLSRDGRVYPLEKPLPQHPNCVIEETVVSGGNVAGATKRWYSGEVVEITVESGNVLTVTPNHPVLTPDGWVGAGFLVEGGHVIGSANPEGFLSVLDPHHDHVPAMIEEVWESFSRQSRVMRRRMPSASEYFHGDGEGGEINIVWADRFLMHSGNAAFIQEMPELLLVLGNAMSALLASYSAAASFANAYFSALNGSMSSLSVAPMLFGGTVGHHQLISQLVVSDWNSTLNQSPADGWTTYPEIFGDGIFGLASQVPRNDGRYIDDMLAIVAQRDSSLRDQASDNFVRDAKVPGQMGAALSGLIKVDKIREVRKFVYKGHVYNLENKNHWYFANGIITHNCRCTLTPVLIGQDLSGYQTGAEWFESLPDSQKRQMMSGKAYDLYQSGEIALQDFEGEKHSRKWGVTTYERSVKEILADR